MTSHLNQKHPGPDKSLLWNHIDLIKSMIREGQSWEEIASQLQKKRGVSLHKSTICNFYQRLIHRKKPMPDGIKDDRHAPIQPSQKLFFTRKTIDDSPRQLQVID